MELTPNALANALGSTATGVKNQLVNLFAPTDTSALPYASQLASVARQQKLAEMLSQMGTQEIPVSSAGGISAPISPLAVLAKGLQSGAGGYLGAKADQNALDIANKGNENFSKSLANYYIDPGVAGSQLTPDSSMSLNLPSVSRPVFDKGANAFVPGATAVAPTDVALPGITTGSTPSHTRTLAERVAYDIANMQGGNPAQTAHFGTQYTTDAAKYQELQQLTPQVNSMLADPTISAPIKSSLASMLAAGDTTGITKYMGDIRSKNILSPKDQAELDDQNKYLKNHPGSTLQDYAAQGAGLKATAEQTAAWPFKVQQSALDQKREENLASFTAGMSNSPPVQIGYTGPDGEDVQVAATWNRKLGTYVNASTMQPINNVKDLRVIGNATGGGRSAAMAGRVSTAALDATTDIQNLSGIGTGASMGLFTNVLNTPASALGRTLTTQEVQDTKVTMAGLSRAMSLLGSGGMQGSDAVMKSFDALQPQEGDTMFTTMRKLGSFRQQAINGMDAALANPMYSPAQKAQLREAKANIITAVPWVPKDVQELENKGKTGTSMGEIFSARLGKKSGGAAAPGGAVAPGGALPKVRSFNPATGKIE